MTNSQRVCSMLKSEHSVLRQALATLGEHAQGGAEALSLPRVRLLVEFVEEFDRRSRSARETAQLIDALRLKSPEADRLLQALLRVREGCEEEFAHVRSLLTSAEQGAPDAVPALAAALPHYCGVMLRLMRAEEQLLCDLAQRLLHDDDWMRIDGRLGGGVDERPEAPPRRETLRVALRALVLQGQG